MKTPFVTKDQLEAICQQYPTPFHLYDEAGIRQTAREVNQAFAWNPGFREYFAVKATPTPGILKVLKEEGFFREEDPLPMSMEVTVMDGESEDAVLAGTKRAFNRAWALL